MARKILIVDDEPLIVKGLKYSLEQDGYETDSAVDGEEAVNKFFAGQFDLVLLDVMLPKIDGIEVCQRIREKSNVPIIMPVSYTHLDVYKRQELHNAGYVKETMELLKKSGHTYEKDGALWLKTTDFRCV